MNNYTLVMRSDANGRAVLSGGNASRLFEVGSSGKLELHSMLLIDGRAQVADKAILDD